MVKLLCDLNSVLQLPVKGWLLQKFCAVHVHLPRQGFGNSFAKKSAISRTEIQAAPKQGHLVRANREEIAAGLPTLHEVAPKFARQLVT